MNSFYKYFLAILFFFVTFIINGQETKLNFTYGVLPVSTEGEKSYDKVIKSKIYKKLLNIGSSEAIPNYSMVIRPQFIVYTSDISATAPQYYTSDMELSIVISDLGSTVVFGSYDYPIKGSGRSEEKAILNCIKRLNFNTIKFRDFLKQADVKIAAYIEQNAEAILSEAKVLKNMGDNLDKDQAHIVLSRLGMLVQHDVQKAEAMTYINDISQNLAKVVKVENDLRDTIAMQQTEIEEIKEKYENQKEINSNLSSTISNIPVRDYSVPTSWNELFLGIATKVSSKFMESF